jgi:L-seryl-tRNA(Ser) seleniumtransferase
MVEVGTTNITRLEDYTAALGANTAMVLMVHSSNFRIRGFTARPSIRELAPSLPEDVLMVVDQGSGTTTERIPGEQSVSHYLKSGAHLVSFSGDKVLGGPQAGFIVGKEELIQTLARHPLNRVFRPGKTIFSLMEEALIARLNRTAPPPVEAVLNLPFAGGGSAPDERFPSLSIELESAERPQGLLTALRELDPPIIGIIVDGKVQLNLATLLAEELQTVKEALNQLLSGKS